MIEMFREHTPVIPRCLLHVGAATGGEAGPYRACGIKSVIWVEAIPSVFDRLRQAVEPYGDRCFNVLASDTDGDLVPFWVTSNDGMSSSMLPLSGHLTLFPDVKVSGTLRLVTRRLDNFLDANKVRRGSIDGIVLDVQGAELKVLRGLGGYLRGVQVVVTEFSRIPLYVGGVLFDELDDFLVRSGFKRITELGSVHGDALYVRRDVRMGPRIRRVRGA